ncbi:hypothetical protein HYY69_02555 [Candidatus Woesearchaeota archaeon]|nr:hypothetical protein [Candidatus Woesearchaeota archaeon]
MNIRIALMLTLLLSMVILTACGVFYPTDDEKERGGYNKEGEKTCRCFTLVPTGRSCKCLNEVTSGEADKKEDNK